VAEPDRRRHASQAIAVLALFGGYLTPIAMATGEPHSVIFLGYVTVLNIATILLARRRVWPALELLAAVATAVLYGGWLGSAPSADVERPIATVFAGVFYVQYAIAQSRIPWAFAQMFGPIVMALLWDAPEVRLALLLAFALAGLLVAERRRGRAAPLWTAIWFWLPELVHAAVHRPLIAIELAGTSIAFAGFVAWIMWTHVRSRGRSSQRHDRRDLGPDGGLRRAADRAGRRPPPRARSHHGPGPHGDRGAQALRQRRVVARPRFPGRGVPRARRPLARRVVRLLALSLRDRPALEGRAGRRGDEPRRDVIGRSVCAPPVPVSRSPPPELLAYVGFRWTKSLDQ